MIKGIDISGIQVVDDWQAVKDAGIRFVYLKVTEGMAGADPRFRAHLDGARRVGIEGIGGYHFGRVSLSPGMATLRDDAIGEAQRYLSISGELGREVGELPPALDLETHNGMRAEWVSAWARLWLDEVGQHVERTCVLYTGTYDAFTGASMAQVHHLLVDAGKHPLWFPRYLLTRTPAGGKRAQSWEEAIATPLPQLPPWGRPCVLQFSGGDNTLPGNLIPGIRGWVDCDLFTGSESEFRTFCNRDEVHPDETGPHDMSAAA
jgi:GH25 family lysozyme M1 (1,4-beta-N-acetylmuramidase)